MIISFQAPCHGQEHFAADQGLEMIRLELILELCSKVMAQHLLLGCLVSAPGLLSQRDRRASAESPRGPREVPAGAWPGREDRALSS